MKKVLFILVSSVVYIPMAQALASHEGRHRHN